MHWTKKSMLVNQKNAYVNSYLKTDFIGCYECRDKSPQDTTRTSNWALILNLGEVD